MIVLLTSLAVAGDFALVTTGTFHGDEMSHQTSDGWLGLYKTDDGYELRATSITVTPVRDEVIDEGDRMSGKQVEASAGDDALFLFKGPGLTARKVVAVVDESRFVYPGQTISHRSGDGWLDITAVGGATKEVPQPGHAVQFEGYALHLTERVGSETRGVAIEPDRESWDDRRPNLVFVGDLDGDGKLDAIVDPSGHYNVSNPTLLLSAPAGPGGVLKVVANLHTTGC